MPIPFVKMHGAGNDFVVIDERKAPLDLSPNQVRHLADRHRGIGCDQFITLHPPPPKTDADLLMRIRNPDGQEAGACGNATRCVAELLFEEDGRPYHVIRTSAGDLTAERLGDGRIRVDMGVAWLGWDDIPLAHEADTLHLPLPGAPAACSMGNPHVTFFVRIPTWSSSTARAGSATSCSPRGSMSVMPRCLTPAGCDCAFGSAAPG